MKELLQLPFLRTALSVAVVTSYLVETSVVASRHAEVDSSIVACVESVAVALVSSLAVWCGSSSVRLSCWLSGWSSSSGPSSLDSKTWSWSYTVAAATAYTDCAVGPWVVVA